MLYKSILVTLLSIAPALALPQDVTAREQQQALFNECQAETDDNLSATCYGFKVAMKYCVNFQRCIPENYRLVAKNDLVWMHDNSGARTPFLLSLGNDGQILMTVPESDTSWQTLMARDPALSPWVMVPLDPLIAPTGGYGAVLQAPFADVFQENVQGSD